MREGCAVSPLVLEFGALQVRAVEVPLQQGNVIL